MTGSAMANRLSFETALTRLLRMRFERFIRILMLRSEGVSPRVSKHVPQAGARP